MASKQASVNVPKEGQVGSGSGSSDAPVRRPTKAKGMSVRPSSWQSN